MNYNYDRTKTAGRRLDNGLKRQINADLDRAGFGGKARFRKIGAALNMATGVLARHGIEPDETLNAHKFPEHGGTATVRLALSNDADPFSPEEITNTMLALQWTELEPGRVEVIAYLS